MIYKTSYVITLFIMIIILIVLAYKAKKRNTNIAMAMYRLTYSVVITVSASVLALLIPSEPVALFLQTLHYATTEWMLIFLLSFLEQYTGEFRASVKQRMAFFVSSTLLSIMLLCNVFYKNIVSCYYISHDGVTYRMFATISPCYEIHAYFSYMLAVFCLLALIAKTYRTIRFYQIKYAPAVLAFIITIAMEGVCMYFNAKLDYALFGYIGLAIFLIYHTVFYQNRLLIANTLSYAVSTGNNGVVCFDIDKKCIYVNDVISRFFPEYKSYEDFEELFRGYNTTNTLSDDYTRVIQIDNEINGEIHHLEVTFNTIKDSRNDYIGTSFYVIDRTKDIIAYEQEHYAATHDALTGLYNIAGFDAEVEKLMKHNDSCYMVASDIKEFKLINDLFGYDKGDEILVTLANEMKKALGDNVVCGRINSDRFAFCIPADEYNEDVFKSAIKPVQALLDKEHLQLCIHLGIYKVNGKAATTWIMYDHARIALLEIRDNYDKLFNYYDSDIMQRLVREKSLVSDFDESMASHSFKMYLQPQISSKTGEMIGAEALVRWEHPIRGMISPGEFVPLFEKSGLIHKLDQYMWEQAAARLKEWKLAGKTDYYISVNISPIDFYYLDVYKTIVDIVERYDISPSNLKLEITESAFMNNPESQLMLIDKLKNYGFYVEIDDFGSGYSSLNMLKDMKVDVLKIDMGFLRSTEADARAKSIIKLIMSLAKELEMIVVTEGVETVEQVEFLTEIGCDVFQGYYFDRPIDVEVFEQKYFK